MNLQRKINKIEAQNLQNLSEQVHKLIIIFKITFIIGT